VRDTNREKTPLGPKLILVKRRAGGNDKKKIVENLKRTFQGASRVNHVKSGAQREKSRDGGREKQQKRQGKLKAGVTGGGWGRPQERRGMSTPSKPLNRELETMGR